MTPLGDSDVYALNKPHTPKHTSNSSVKETQNGSSWKCQRYTSNANEAFCSLLLLQIRDDEIDLPILSIIISDTEGTFSIFTPDGFMTVGSPVV